jgi:hypothetical protein
VTLYPGVVYGPGKLTTGNALAKMVRSSTWSRCFWWLGNI